MVDADPLDALASDDDEKLFDDITQGSDDSPPPGPDPAPEPPQAAPEPAPQPAAPAAGEEPTASPEPPQPHPEGVVRHVPLRELLDEREKRQTAERRAEERERAIQQILAAQKAAEQPRPDPAIWDQPDGWIEQKLTPLQKAQFEATHSTSEELARIRHGDEVVDKALQAMESAMGTRDAEAVSAWQRMMGSRRPYQDLVDWFKRSEPVRDPQGYRTRLQDDLLKDPAFLQKAQEALRASAASNPVTHQPNAAASLPSVSRAGVPASTSEGEDPFGKMADDDAYEFVLRDKQGRFASRA
jgi:hypothetical protein